ILSDSNSSGIKPGTVHPDPDPTPDPAPDPHPDPDPPPERPTAALSGVSALKTPITQRSSPPTPPNAPTRPWACPQARHGFTRPQTPPSDPGLARKSLTVDQAALA